MSASEYFQIGEVVELVDEDTKESIEAEVLEIMSVGDNDYIAFIDLKELESQQENVTIYFLKYMDGELEAVTEELEYHRVSKEFERLIEDR